MYYKLCFVIYKLWTEIDLIGLEAFAATEFIEIFSRRRPRQDVKYSDLSGINSDPVYRVCWWFVSTKNEIDVSSRTCVTKSMNMKTKLNYTTLNLVDPQWPHGLRRGSAAARLLGLCVRIPPVAWMSVCLESCVLSGRGLCVGLITRPEEIYRLWCVWMWSVSLDNEEALGGGGLLRHRKKKYT